MQNALPEFDVKLTSRRVRVLWVLLSAVGMAVAAAVARPLSYLVGGAAHDALGPVFGEAIVGVVAGGGTLGGVALAQWPLLRRRVAWAARWPAAGAAAGAAGAAAGFGALAGLTLLGAEVLGAAAVLVFGIAAFLRAHTLVLRGHVSRPMWLAGGCAAGFLGAAVATMVVGSFSGLDGESPLFGAVFGLVYGWVTVLVLGRLVRNSG